MFRFRYVGCVPISTASLTNGHPHLKVEILKNNRKMVYLYYVTPYLTIKWSPETSGGTETNLISCLAGRWMKKIGTSVQIIIVLKFENKLYFETDYFLQIHILFLK